MNTETEAEEFFSKALMVILLLLDTLPRNEREELLHHVQCSLADVNRMYGQVLFSDGYDDVEKDDLAGGIADVQPVSKPLSSTSSKKTTPMALPPHSLRRPASANSAPANSSTG